MYQDPINHERIVAVVVSMLLMLAAGLWLLVAVGCKSAPKQTFRYNYPDAIAAECWGARNNAFACIERVTGRKVREQGRSLTVTLKNGEKLINGRWAWKWDGIWVSGLYDEPTAGEHVIFIGVDPVTGKLGPNSTIDLMHEHGHVGAVWAGLGRGHPAEIAECFNRWNAPK